MDVTAEKLHAETTRNRNRTYYVGASGPLNLAKLSCELEDLTDLQDAYMEAKRLYAEAVLNWADEVVRTAPERETDFNPFGGGRPTIQIKLGKVTGQGYDPTLAGALIDWAAPNRPWQEILPSLLEELYGDEGKQLGDLLLAQPAALLVKGQTTVVDSGYDTYSQRHDRLAELRQKHLANMLRRNGDSEGADLISLLQNRFFLADGDITWRGRLVRLLQEEDADEAADAVLRDSYIPVELTWGRLLIVRGQLEMALALVR